MSNADDLIGTPRNGGPDDVDEDRPMQRTPDWWERIPQKSILFLVGIALILNEALIRNGPERPTLIVLYGAMVGLPFVLWAKGGGGSSDGGGQP